VARAEFDPSGLFELLVRHDVDFVVIGGIAAAVHGSAQATFDIDIAYARDSENLGRLAQALRELDADGETHALGQNFTFATRFGPLDMTGDPAGAPPYRDLRAHATAVVIRGFTLHVASIDHLIAMKEAAGRLRDKAAAQELRAISDERRQPRE
jgi:hypothetical protein